MSNTTRPIQLTLRQVLTCRAFVEGFAEARKGLPLDPDKWAGRYARPVGELGRMYERGRAFALELTATGHPLSRAPLKVGRDLTPGMVAAYYEARGSVALV